VLAEAFAHAIRLDDRRHESPQSSKYGAILPTGPAPHNPAEAFLPA
jgi:hypothetical protein